MGRSGHLVDGGRDLIGLVALSGHGLFGALGLAGYAADQTEQLVGGHRHLLHQRMNLGHEGIEGRRQLAQLVATGNRQTLGQITLSGGHVIELALDQLYRLGDRCRQRQGQQRQHQQQTNGRADHDHQQAVDALLELSTRRLDVTLHTVEIDRGTEDHLPLGQVVRVADLGHQHLAVAKNKAVVHVMAAIGAGPHQLTNGVYTVGVAVATEVLADAIVGVALQDAADVAVVAPEVTVRTVGQALQHLDGLGARVHVAVGGCLIQRGNRIERQLDVLLDLRLAVRHQLGSGLGLLMIGQVTENDESDGTEQQGQQADRPQSQQQHFGTQTQREEHWHHPFNGTSILKGGHFDNSVTSKE